eukprot:scaffold171503_cov10-Prasinocladus_malaysianus.AAC.1
MLWTASFARSVGRTGCVLRTARSVGRAGSGAGASGEGPPTEKSTGRIFRGPARASSDRDVVLLDPDLERHRHLQRGVDDQGEAVRRGVGVVDPVDVGHQLGHRRRVDVEGAAGRVELPGHPDVERPDVPVRVGRAELEDLVALLA